MKPLLLALTLLLATCANKSANPNVRIAIVGTGLQTSVIPLFLADSLGFYKDEGLDVTIENLASNEKSMQALVGGSVDVAAASFSQLLYLSAEGQHVRSFFVGVRRNSFVLIVAPSANARIQRPEDLKGAVIGTIGATGLPFLNHYMAAHGILTTEFSAVTIGVGQSAIAAIESGRIAAANVAGGDHIRLLQRHPNLRILVDSSTSPGMIETFGSEAYAAGTLAAKQSWLDNNPDTARRLARASHRALQWIATHTPEQIREQFPPSFRSPDAAVDLDIIRWASPGFTPDGRMPNGAPEAWKRHLGTLAENIRNAKFDLNATWTNEFLPTTK